MNTLEERMPTDWLGFRLKHRRIDDGPKMDNPSEEDDPKRSREHKMKNGGEHSALQQLAQTRDEEAA